MRIAVVPEAGFAVDSIAGNDPKQTVRNHNFRSQLPLRIAQYFVLIIFGIGGLFLGNHIGPLSGLLIHWDQFMDPEFSRVIRRYHGIVVGACTTLPMLIVGRLFQIKELPVFITTMSLGAVFYFLTALRVSGLQFIPIDISLLFLVGLHVAGSFAPFGAMLLFDRLWSIVRDAQRA